MEIISADEKRYVDVGNSDIWNCFYSTVITKLKELSDDIPLALLFLKNKECEPENCIETARQMDLIRDNLSKLSINELVYDYNKPKKKAPWQGNLSPIITSCGNFFTTADGKDLIFEINTVLCYCGIKKMNVKCR